MQKMVSSCFSFLVKTGKKKKKPGGAGIASGEIRAGDGGAGPG